MPDLVSRCDDARMRRTVVIVDDHAGFRAVARALLEDEGFDVVGEAGNGTSAIEAAARLKPDVLLLDVYLPDLDGFAVAEQIDREGNQVAVVLTSSRNASSFRRRLAESSARGFISKDELTGAAFRSLVDHS
jgi:DNA-binding NarL/FixJ family response regulator